MKYIFVTGGVCSSLGKGVAAASIACLLENAGYSVSMQKMDPYLNIDPGTMSPFQHGEVFVTDDGAETDLDLGNYERFTRNSNCSRINSVTTGQIYDTVIKRERQGGYLGKTVQIIPHITDEIKSRIKSAGKGNDILIVEIGGTVGDIESVPFLEAIRQFRRDAGKENTLFIHLTLIPYLGAAQEAKSKPTQHSVKELQSIGISPDILMCRTNKQLTEEMREKLALFCNVEPEAVIAAMDINTTIYEIPVIYKQQGLARIIEKKLNLKYRKSDLSKWAKKVETYLNPKKECTILVAGKYVALNDAYKSIYEALIHAGIDNSSRVKIIKLNSEKLEGISFSKVESRLNKLEGTGGDFMKNVNGILVPGGFGERGFEGMLSIARFAREKKIPYFGICLGLHVLSVEFARNVLGHKEATTTEIDPMTPYPVISLLEEQEKVLAKGGTMRLGAYTGSVKKGSCLYRAYRNTTISERHRHRYEFENKYRSEFEQAGMVFSVINRDNDLVEAMELLDHPWYAAVQFHPEFKSKPLAPAPLFTAFIRACLDSDCE